MKVTQKVGIKLRQPYTFIGQKAFVQSARYAHACQFNRAKAQTRKMRVMLGRVIRDTQRKTLVMALPTKAQTRLNKLLEIARRIHSKQRVRAEGLFTQDQLRACPQVGVHRQRQGAHAWGMRSMLCCAPAGGLGNSGDLIGVLGGLLQRR